jgi:hypothetical protein
MLMLLLLLQAHAYGGGGDDDDDDDSSSSSSGHRRRIGAVQVTMLQIVLVALVLLVFAFAVYVITRHFRGSASSDQMLNAFQQLQRRHANRNHDDNVLPTDSAPARKQQQQHNKHKQRDVADDAPRVLEHMPRFDASDDAAYAYLAKHGYCVFKQALDEAQTAHALDLLWRFLEGLTQLGLERADPQTWRLWPGMPSNGILAGWGIGQSAFMWFLRGSTVVQRVFERIWRTRDLLVSMDGCGMFRPWHAGNSGKGANPLWKTKGGWFHLDQNAQLTRGLRSVQGLVSLKDQHEGTGGLVVLPGSHKFHDAVCARMPASRREFVRLRRDDPVFSEASVGVPTLVTCRAGDLIVWDSRTVHCNTPAFGTPKQQRKKRVLRSMPSLSLQLNDYNNDDDDDDDDESSSEKTTTTRHRHNEMKMRRGTARKPLGLLRVVGYLCMAPAVGVDDATLLKRRQCVLELKTTTHWPTKCQCVDGGLKEPIDGFRPGAAGALTKAQQLLVGGSRLPTLTSQSLPVPSSSSSSSSSAVSAAATSAASTTKQANTASKEAKKKAD